MISGRCRQWYALLLLAPCLATNGCIRGQTVAGGKLPVACTTTMVGDLVRQIGGDRVDVQVIMGPGVDPHTFKPAPGDIARLVSAPIVFFNGLHLEGKMVELFEDKMHDKSHAIAAALPTDRLLAWRVGEAGAHDPHIWFDVGLWAMGVPLVRDRLTAADPEGAAVYRANAELVAEHLAALDAEVRTKLAAIPEGRRVLITSHDAYSYFGRAYGVNVRGLQGISTETEAGLREVNQAVDYIVQNRIPAVFVETSVSPKTVQRVISDCQGRGWNVRLGGELFSDAMGSPGQHPGYAVETYEGMVRFNVDTLVKAMDRGE